MHEIFDEIFLLKKYYTKQSHLEHKWDVNKQTFFLILFLYFLHIFLIRCEASIFTHFILGF